MVKSKQNALASLPKDQRCRFLIGPASSWFIQVSDIWTQPKTNAALINRISQDASMDCDQMGTNGQSNNLSYFIYGASGCFCYGEIYHHSSGSHQVHNTNRPEKRVKVLVNRLVDIKEDNSRVTCVRFLKPSVYPLAMILTESGTFLIHNCITNEDLALHRRYDLLGYLLGSSIYHEDTNTTEHRTKRPKISTQPQIRYCEWPTPTNAFLGITLTKRRTNLLVWLKLKDLTATRDNPGHLSKSELIDSHVITELSLPGESMVSLGPIVCMRSAVVDSKTCLIAIGMDSGHIIVANADISENKVRRLINLKRHNDQITSLSFFVGNQFPNGILASTSRGGLVLVWDIETEVNFADYQGLSDGGNSKWDDRINWFAVSFVPLKGITQIHLAVSNSESGLTLLEIPTRIRSGKVRLMGKKQSKDVNLRHVKLIFEISYDPITETLLTSSLDGNHIFWRCFPHETSLKKDSRLFDAIPQYLYPSMPNNARTHMLRHNPIREGLLGVAMGKAGVTFHKFGGNQIGFTHDETSGSCGKICRDMVKQNLSPTSLAWHPSHEYRIAIGTIEGKVFRADLTPRKAILTQAENTTRKLPADTKPPLAPAKLVDDPFDVEYNPLERQEDEISMINDELTLDNRNFQDDRQKVDGIYSLCWGPNPVDHQDKSRSAIYAIGSRTHRLFIYYNCKENTNDKLTNYLDEVHDESLPESDGMASEVSWKASMDLMALGTTTGKVIIASYNQIKVVTLCDGQIDESINLFTKLAVIEGPLCGSYIQCLAWHPTTDENDNLYYTIAVSSSESPVFVFNIKENLLVADVKNRLKIEDMGTVKQENPSANIVSSYIAKLDAHTKAISDIVWNPHEPDQLATCSFDRHCYVWSVMDHTSGDVWFDALAGNDEGNNDGLDSRKSQNALILAKFSARNRLFTLDWSIIEPDLIFTSGHDSTIWAWRPSENRL